MSDRALPDRSSIGSPNRRSELRRDLLCGGLLTAAFVTFICLSWRTWPDILVDFGQELYVPWRLSEGDVLYRDVAWVTGPLSQYANAALFRLFGVSLTTVIAANLVLLAGIVVMLYCLLRRCGNRWSATSGCLFFLAVFAFGHYSVIGNYNYVCPYRHDITHGLALGLINLLSLAQFGRTRRRIWLVVSGVSFGLLCLTKIEMTLAASLTIAAALPVFAWQPGQGVAGVGGVSEPGKALSRLLQRIRDVCCWSGIVAAFAIVPIAVAVGALAVPLGWANSFRQIFVQYRLVVAPELSASSGYYRTVSGSDRLTENLILMALATTFVLAAAVVGYVAQSVAGSGGSRRVNLRAAILGITAFFLGLQFVPLHEWHALPSCLPVLLIPVILLTLPSALRDSQSSQTMLLLAAIYSIGLLPKILFRVGWVHYGFVLAMPGTLVLIHVGLHTIPAMWRGRRRTGRCFQAVIGGLLAACAVSLASVWIRIDQAHTVAVGDHGDRFFARPDYDGRTLPTVKTLAYLQEHLKNHDSLIVFPNGVMLNYLLRKRNPTPFIMFNPWESDVHGGELRIADTIISAAPDYAVIVTMDLTIHGRGNFGSPDFGGQICNFLNERYDIVDQQMSQGSIEGQFIATVFKRRSKEDQFDQTRRVGTAQ